MILLTIQFCCVILTFNIISSVTWMEVEYYNEYHSRLTVLGTMFGTILATCVEVMSDGKGGKEDGVGGYQ